MGRFVRKGIEEKSSGSPPGPGTDCEGYSSHTRESLTSLQDDKSSSPKTDVPRKSIQKSEGYFIVFWSIIVSCKI